MAEVPREEAARIAAEDLKVCPAPGYEGIAQVPSLDELIRSRRSRPRAFSLTTDLPEDRWIIYLHSVVVGGLQSSLILVVSRRDGRVPYRGSTHDEG